MKKTLSIFLGLLLVFIVAACNRNIEKLDSPVISLNQDTISWAEVKDAEEYYVYVDTRVDSELTTNLTFDLKTLNLPVGIHKISVTAAKENKEQESSRSNEVSFEVSYVATTKHKTDLLKIFNANYRLDMKESDFSKSDDYYTYLGYLQTVDAIIEVTSKTKINDDNRIQILTKVFNFSQRETAPTIEDVFKLYDDVLKENIDEDSLAKLFYEMLILNIKMYYQVTSQSGTTSVSDEGQAFIEALTKEKDNIITSLKDLFKFIMSIRNAFSKEVLTDIQNAIETGEMTEAQILSIKDSLVDQMIYYLPSQASLSLAIRTSLNIIGEMTDFSLSQNETFANLQAKYIHETLLISLNMIKEFDTTDLTRLNTLINNFDPSLDPQNALFEVYGFFIEYYLTYAQNNQIDVNKVLTKDEFNVFYQSYLELISYVFFAYNGPENSIIDYFKDFENTAYELYVMFGKENQFILEHYVDVFKAVNLINLEGATPIERAREIDKLLSLFMDLQDKTLYSLNETQIRNITKLMAQLSGEINQTFIDDMATLMVQIHELYQAFVPYLETANFTEAVEEYPNIDEWIVHSKVYAHVITEALTENHIQAVVDFVLAVRNFNNKHYDLEDTTTETDIRNAINQFVTNINRINDLDLDMLTLEDQQLIFDVMSQIFGSGLPTASRNAKETISIQLQNDEPFIDARTTNYYYLRYQYEATEDIKLVINATYQSGYVTLKREFYGYGDYIDSSRPYQIMLYKGESIEINYQPYMLNDSFELIVSEFSNKLYFDSQKEEYLSVVFEYGEDGYTLEVAHSGYYYIVPYYNVSLLDAYGNRLVDFDGRLYYVYLNQGEKYLFEIYHFDQGQVKIFKEPQVIEATNEENTEFMHDVYMDNENSRFLSFTAPKQGLYQFTLSDEELIFTIYTYVPIVGFVSQQVYDQKLFLLEGETILLAFGISMNQTLNAVYMHEMINYDDQIVTINFKNNYDMYNISVAETGYYIFKSVYIYMQIATDFGYNSLYTLYDNSPYVIVYLESGQDHPVFINFEDTLTIQKMDVPNVKIDLSDAYTYEGVSEQYIQINVVETGFYEFYSLSTDQVYPLLLIDIDNYYIHFNVGQGYANTMYLEEGNTYLLVLTHDNLDYNFSVRKTN